MDELKRYTEANRAAWNEVMPRHQKANGARWDEAFAKPGYSVFDEIERGALSELGVAGRRVAHLCCNNGIELMSLRNLGAGVCVGFDISDLAIEEATARARACNIDCEFLRYDVYEIPARFHGAFDIVYVSIGCLGWMPDLGRFLKAAAHLLAPGGALFVREMHPFAEMLSSDGMTDADPLKIIEPYFKNEPYVETTGLDYVGGENYEAKPQYWFVWTLSDILTQLLANGFRLLRFSEHEEDISACHRRNQEAGIPIPLSYILVAAHEG